MTVTLYYSLMSGSLIPAALFLFLNIALIICLCTNFLIVCSSSMTNAIGNLIGIASQVKAVATHSSSLAWKIPWMEEPGRLQSMGSHRVKHD